MYRLIKAGKIPAVRVGTPMAVPQTRHRRLARHASARAANGHRRRAHADRPQAATGAAAVLVVDDESSIRELLQKTLALAEYDVDTAPDGRAALERLRLGHYDLLIADLKMPGMDGLTLIREAKRLRPTCRSSSSPASPPSRAPSRRSISASPAI